MNNRDKSILIKIIKETAVIADIIYKLDESTFLASEEKMRAVNMTLINIGELVKNISQDFRSRHQNIPWKDIAGFRDVAAHGYFTLRMTDVWIYAQKELPVVADNIKIIVGAIDTRCGLRCDGCSYIESHNCGECIKTNGNPFHGKCPVAECCQSKNFLHCGECPDIPCDLLSQYSCDSEHGDNPPGKRIEQCKEWAKIFL